MNRQNSKWETVRTHCFSNRMYEVSDEGKFFRNGKEVTNKPDGRNSITISMIDNDGKSVRFKMHQLILQTFNPTGYREKQSVDHRNRNRLDNSLQNLRYADKKTQFMNRENVSYKIKRVICKENKKTYESCKEAEEDLNLPKNTVARVARKERKHSMGFTFEWVK